MTNIVLCPNCGGQKTMSKPPYIAGDVNAWVGSGTPTYSCPTCDGKGWVDTEEDSVSQDDFDNVKFVALSVMETAENMMDECTKRADRIKELEAGLERTEDKLRVMKEMRDELLEDWEKKRGEVARLKTIVHELEADEVCLNSSIKAFRAVIGEKDLRIADMESQRDMVSKTHDAREEELLGIIYDLTTKNQLIECQNICMSEKLRNAPNCAAWHSQAEVDSMRKMFDRRCEELASAGTFDRELLDKILRIVNPLIKSGAYAKPSIEIRLLSREMYDLCRTVVQYRRNHNIVG